MSVSSKNILIIFLIITVVALLYRIFDLGVTITYLEADLTRSQKVSRVVQKFQRSRCIPVEEIADEFYAFKKEGYYIIGGVKFKCKMNEDRKVKVFTHP